MMVLLVLLVHRVHRVHRVRVVGLVVCLVLQEHVALLVVLVVHSGIASMHQVLWTALFLIVVGC
jgi:hypothetical protein